MAEEEIIKEHEKHALQDLLDKTKTTTRRCEYDRCNRPRTENAV